MFEQYLTNIKNAFKKQKKYKEKFELTDYTMYKYFTFRITDEAVKNAKTLNKCIIKIKYKIFPVKAFTTDKIEIYASEIMFSNAVKGVIIYQRIFPFNIIDYIKTTYLKRYIDIYKRYKYLIKYIIDRKKYEN